MQHPPKKSSRKKHPWLLPALLTALLAAAAAVLLLLPGWKQQAVSSAMPDSPADRQKNLSQTDAATLLSLRVQQLNGEDYTLQYKDGSLWLEENTPISESVSAEMLEAVTLISTTDQVAADVEEVREHLTDMGLEPPQITVTATYSDGRTETLKIGGEVPETTYRYLRWSGDPGVYMGDIGIGEVFSMTRNRLIAVEQPEISTALVDTVQLENAAGTVSVRFTVDSAGYASAALTAPENYPMDAEKAQSLQSALNNFRLGTPEGMLTDETREANMTKSNSYNDVKDGDWFCCAVSTLSKMGIIKGYEDGSFKPDQKITRAETMTLVNRVLKRLPETKDDLHKDMKTWPDNQNESAWFYLAVQEATNSHYQKLKKDGTHETWESMRETRDWAALEK